MSLMKKLIFPDPSQHPEWIRPHSEEWYMQLGAEDGGYKYPWKSEFDEPTAETLFIEKISSYLLNDSRLLDIGCGHGEFTYQFADKAQEVVGIDIIKDFINTANKDINNACRFLTVDVNNGLPFPDEYFDVVCTKKGPWLFNELNREGNRVIKPSGVAMAFLHFGTGGALRELFPGLYAPLPLNSNSIERAKQELRLSESRLRDIDIQLIEESEYLSTPEDVLIKKCYGQSKKLKEFVWHECLNGVEKIFEKNATQTGLKVKNYNCIVTARA